MREPGHNGTNSLGHENISILARESSDYHSHASNYAKPVQHLHVPGFKPDSERSIKLRQPELVLLDVLKRNTEKLFICCFWRCNNSSNHETTHCALSQRTRRYSGWPVHCICSQLLCGGTHSCAQYGADPKEWAHRRHYCEDAWRLSDRSLEDSRPVRHLPDRRLARCPLHTNFLHPPSDERLLGQIGSDQKEYAQKRQASFRPLQRSLWTFTSYRCQLFNLPTNSTYRHGRRWREPAK